jgi:hypothetical protein
LPCGRFPQSFTDKFTPSSAHAIFIISDSEICHGTVSGEKAV